MSLVLKKQDIGSELVSVMMPAYNADLYISKAIESILNQSYSQLELLIIDDGSTDNTRRVINSFASEDKRIRTFHNPLNRGNINTINNLFQAARGTYITIQDADDWSHPNRIMNQVDAMKYNGLMVCGTQSFNCTEKGDVYSQTSYPTDHHSVLNAIPESFPITCATVMIHRRVYQKVGGYEMYFNRLGAADLYWFAKVIDSFEFENVDTPLYYYRRTKKSFSRSIKSEKQLVLNDVVSHLVTQRRGRGVDAIDRGDYTEVERKFNDFLSSRRHISEKHREQAAHAIDQENLGLAFYHITKSLRKELSNPTSYRTLFYLLRRWLLSTYLRHDT